MAAVSPRLCLHACYFAGSSQHQVSQSPEHTSSASLVEQIGLSRALSMFPALVATILLTSQSHCHPKPLVFLAIFE